MTRPRFAICDYGIGNLRSAEKALQFIGADAGLTTDPEAAAAADALVVPGVGHFGACMRALRSSGMEAAVRDAARREVPMLGICVGMQMLFEGSEEDPREPGLGLVSGVVRKLPSTQRLPQIAWNTVEPNEQSGMFEGLGMSPWLYFVHSYAPDPTDASAVAGWSHYGERFACAIEVSNVWATQFHPEKSGKVGLGLLSNFVRAAA